MFWKVSGGVNANFVSYPCIIIYLDNNSTTKPCVEATEAVRYALDEAWANPSSVHRAGQGVRHVVERARADVARLIGARAREVVFTSGGTEAIHLAIRGVVGASTGAGVGGEAPTIISTGVEHAAVRTLLESLAADGVIRLMLASVNGEGLVEMTALERLVEAHSPVLVSVQWANNETGAIQPVERVYEACRKHGALLHCDAVQWVGKMPVASLPCDLMSMSAHKFHGPTGVGALWVRPGVRVAPMMPGTQEVGKRGGTENVPGILGMGAAARAALAWLSDDGERERLAGVRDRFERAVLDGVPGACVNGPMRGEERLWNTSSIAFPGMEAEGLLMLLSERGVCASAGAACSSGSLEPSPVLLAMGLDEARVRGSIRFSLSRETTEEEVDAAARTVIACACAMRETVERTATGVGEEGARG